MLTTTFVELSLMPLAISLVCVLFGGRYLERAWGSREFAKFFLIQALIPNAVCFAVFALLFAFTKTGTYLYGVVNGCIALQTGFLVAFKQLVPEHSIMIFQGLFKAQVKYLAVPIAVGYSVVGLALGQWPKIFLSWSGFFTAWVYLRFYRVQYVESELPLSSNLAAARSERTSIRGDASDTFALAKFFYPALVSDAVSVISDIVYQLLVSLRICTPFSQDDVDASNLQASLRVRAATGASGFHDAEAERRRELARRALEERLRGAPGVTTAS
jgi:membrane associated rhomboid family serine protease